MSIVRVSSPQVEPLLLDQVKNHLRIEDDQLDDDGLIVGLIEAAREHLEGRHGILNTALITQTWDWYLDGFPTYATMPLRVPLPPLQSVVSITYLDENGSSTEWASSNYRVDTVSQPGRITPAFEVAWPLTRSVTNAVTIRFIAGYGSSWNDVPRPLQQAMLMMVGHLYEHRESVVVGAPAIELPQGMQALVAPYRRTWF